LIADFGREERGAIHQHGVSLFSCVAEREVSPTGSLTAYGGGEKGRWGNDIISSILRVGETIGKREEGK